MNIVYYVGLAMMIKLAIQIVQKHAENERIASHPAGEKQMKKTAAPPFGPKPSPPKTAGTRMSFPDMDEWDYIALHPKDTAAVGNMGHEMYGLLRKEHLHLGIWKQVCTLHYDMWQKFDPSVWRSSCTEEEYTALLCVGTFHVNGWHREKCLRLLCEHPDRMPLEIALIRLNDWVPQVRALAVQVLPEMLHSAAPDELLAVTECICEVMLGRRWQGILSEQVLYQAYADKLSAEPELLFRQSVKLRRSSYRLISKAERQNWNAWRYCLDHEEDYALRQFAVLFLMLGDPEDIPEPRLIDLQSDKNPKIRLAACERRLKQRGIWPDFEKLLADPSRGVREFAGWHMKQRFQNPADYARAHLPECANALAEYGTKEDAPAVRAYLDEAPEKILPALIALGTPDAEELLWKYLQSDIPAASRCAYRIAMRRRVLFDPEALYRLHAALGWQAQLGGSRYVHLLCLHTDWAALPYLLRCYANPGYLDSAQIIGAVCRRNPNTSRITPELASAIRNELLQAQVRVEQHPWKTIQPIPEQVVNSLEFDLKRLTE